MAPSAAEWEARQQLAACYRVFDMLGWSEMIYNHITLKVPNEDGAFLINPFGLHFSEVTASSLVKIDIDGNKLADSPYPVNLAGFTQHAVFLASAVAMVVASVIAAALIRGSREQLMPAARERATVAHLG